jgi:lambda repressor-like predicted transcriptional regulator
LSAVLTPEQEKAVAEQTAKVADLAKIAGDPNVDPILRIEAQNKLNGMSIRAIAAQGGLSGGLKDVLKAAAPQIERAETAYRELTNTGQIVEARLARLETNIKKFLEKQGLTYE